MTSQRVYQARLRKIADKSKLLREIADSDMIYDENVRSWAENEARVLGERLFSIMEAQGTNAVSS